MNTVQDLKRLLQRIDGKSYGAYKETAGEYGCGNYRLCIDHVQGDPFAAPSKIRVVVKLSDTKIPPRLYGSAVAAVAAEDFLLRVFSANIRRYSAGKSGSGNSGKIAACYCGQEVLRRSAMQIGRTEIEARFEIGFPAQGRRILAGGLIRIFEEQLPRIVEQSLFYSNLNHQAFTAAVELAEDQEYVRQELKRRGLAAFVADGAILPRESGVSDKPLKEGVPFRAPEECAVTMELPHRGTLRGMGIENGITMIAGGGYHGKSTLLKALERGVYNHIGGDGREFVLTEDTAVKVRAEDGRSVCGTDISMFINNLPNGKDTRRFSTENASGSTSQAANVIEAMEAGAKTLLIDEDTSATNFMIRDELMQRIVSADKEPITPFIARIRELYRRFGVSTILVVGSSGSYFHVADRVIQMEEYRPFDITQKAKEAARETIKEFREAEPCAEPVFRRIPQRGILGREDGRMKIRASACEQVSVNKIEIDLRGLEQLVDHGQTAALGYLIRYIGEKVIDGQKTLGEVVDAALRRLEQDGFLAVVGGRYCADFLSMPRRQELFFALDRMRTLRVRP